MILLRFAIFIIFFKFVFGVSSDSMLKIQIEQLPSPRSLCGEGPHWDSRTQSLYYIDIYGPEATLLRYDYNENKTYAATVDNEPLMTFILPVDGIEDQFLVGTKDAAKVISWDGKSKKGKLIRTAFRVETDRFFKANRFNDAKSDPAGRFFGGTMRSAECNGPFNGANGSLYSFDRKRGVEKIKKNVLISNGLAWNVKCNKFYFIDSCTHDIKEFDYDIATGEISNERSIFELIVNGRTPDYIMDGMTIDTEGNLFVATFGGSKIMKINPFSRKVSLEIEIPRVEQITSVAFGGPDLDQIFVTTAWKNGDKSLEAGHLYRMTGSNSIGVPGVKVKV